MIGKSSPELVGSKIKLADKAAVSVKTFVRLEFVDGVPQSRSATLPSMQPAFDIEFVGSPGDRPGIRVAYPGSCFEEISNSAGCAPIRLYSTIYCRRKPSGAFAYSAACASPQISSNLPWNCRWKQSTPCVRHRHEVVQACRLARISRTKPTRTRSGARGSEHYETGCFSIASCGALGSSAPSFQSGQMVFPLDVAGIERMRFSVPLACCIAWMAFPAGPARLSFEVRSMAMKRNSLPCSVRTLAMSICTKPIGQSLTSSLTASRLQFPAAARCRAAANIGATLHGSGRDGCLQA